MSTFNTSKHYLPCQIKFAFDVTTESPLEWCEYFGWNDGYDMLSAFCSKHLKSDSVQFAEMDSSCAKLTIIFESYSAPEDFHKDYNTVLALLDKLTKSPEYNPCNGVLNNMLDTLEEHNVVIYENEPNSRVFEEYNKIEHGFTTYQEHIADIALNKKQAA